MTIQDTFWEVKQVNDKLCGLLEKQSLDFEAAGVNSPSSWGVVDQYFDNGNQADVTYKGDPYRLEIVGGVLICKPQAMTPLKLIESWSSGGPENGSIKLLPWMVSVFGGMIAGIILGICLGIPLTYTLPIAGVAAMSAILIYNFVKVPDPGPTWTAQAGEGAPPGGRTLYERPSPSELCVSRPA
jgi:hypothetical protein